ncbi:MAG: DUF3667 domain-containing protein [Lysobacteraceae bacterium]|nr:DUF3667 domain-containing protein [Xanthomonadales bacterium]
MKQQSSDERDGVTPPRITTRAFIREMSAEALDFDQGLLHTFVSLCSSPGQTMRRWIIDRDPRLTKPFRYFLIMVALALVVQKLAGLAEVPTVDDAGQFWVDAQQLSQAGSADESGQAAQGTEMVARGVIFLRTEHRELLMLMIIPFAALGLWATNRRERWYFAEYWVALTYAYATSYFLQSLFEALLAPLTSQHLVIARVAMYGLLVLMLLRLHPRPLPGAILRTLAGFAVAAFCLIAFIIALAAILTTASRFV